MTTVELVPRKADAAISVVDRQVADAEARANALQVTSEAEANVAGEVLREIARRRKDAEAERKELVGPLNATVKKINQRFKDSLAPLDAADKIVREKVGDFHAEQERIRQKEEARLERERQERERKAREERERQEAAERAKREQAEREAREAEEEAKAARDSADAEAAAKLAEEARQAADEANTAEAAIASLPEPTLPKAMVPAGAKPEGVSSSKRWDFAVTDLAALPTHLPNGEPLIEVRSGPLRRYLHAYIKEHGQPPEMGGVEFKQVDRLAVRT